MTVTTSIAAQQELRIILAVDDSPLGLGVLGALLRQHYRVETAASGMAALDQIAAGLQPDLVLLDIMMPGMDGYEVCQRLKAESRTRDIPVLFLTGLSEDHDEEKGLAAGAVDFITKPIRPPILLARVATHLRMKSMQDLMRSQNEHLEREVRKRTAEARSTQDATILALASLAETRDLETGNHLLRTQHYVRLLAERLRDHPRFAEYLGGRDIIEWLFKCAPLHDIGKVGIPDHILLKPGRYEPAEFEFMKRHTTLGRDALEQAQRGLELSLPFLEVAKQIAYCHHEKWDGSGYPQGLSGEAIPVAARLMAVADVYDALISRRVYKAPMEHAQAAAFLLQGSGSHFDPAVIEAFVALQDDFQSVAAAYADSDADIQAKILLVRASQQRQARQLLQHSRAAHEAFIGRVRAAAQGGAEALELLDAEHPQSGPLGQWYYGEGRRAFGGLSPFNAIEPLHLRSHQLLRDLLGAWRGGQQAEAARIEAELLGAAQGLARYLDALEGAELPAS